MRGYEDSLTSAVTLAPGASVTGIHQVWRSFSVRDRLDRDAGGHEKRVILTGYSPPGNMNTEAFLTMDRRLTSLKPIPRPLQLSKR